MEEGCNPGGHEQQEAPVHASLVVRRAARYVLLLS
jgi:hypothetical protein